MNTFTQLSEQEFLALPDTPGKRELLDGELITLRPAKRSHMQMAKRFARLLETSVDPDRIWIEMPYKVSRGWLQPDVSVSWPEQDTENDWFKGAPMLAIEVVSRGNTAEQIEGKTAAYLNEGAAEVWVVYPKAASMTVSRKGITARITGAYRCDLIGISVTPDLLTPPGK